MQCLSEQLGCTRRPRRSNAPSVDTNFHTCSWLLWLLSSPTYSLRQVLLVQVVSQISCLTYRVLQLGARSVGVLVPCNAEVLVLSILAANQSGAAFCLHRVGVGGGHSCDITIVGDIAITRPKSTPVLHVSVTDGPALSAEWLNEPNIKPSQKVPQAHPL